MMRILCIVTMSATLSLLPRAAKADGSQSTAPADHATVQNALFGPMNANVTIEPVRWRGGYYGWGGPRYDGGWYGAYRPYYGGYYYSTPYYSAYPYSSGYPYYSAYPYTYYYSAPGVRVATPWFGLGVYR